MNFTFNSSHRSNHSHLDVLLPVSSFSKNPKINFLLFIIPALFGLVAQLACLYTFCRIRIRLDLYIYLRAYALNSILLCVFTLLQFPMYTLTTFNSHALISMAKYLSLPGFIFCYFMTIFLDIIILVDRLVPFSPRIRAIMGRRTPMQRLILIFVISILFNIPYQFIFVQTELQLESTTIWFLTISEFFRTIWGKLILYLISFLRDILPMIIQVFLNLYSLYHLRRYFHAKATLSSTDHSQACHRTETKTVVMISVMVTLTMFEHLFLIINTIFDSRLEFIIQFIISIRRFFDFIVYFTFNRVFRNTFLALF